MIKNRDVYLRGLLVIALLMYVSLPAVAFHEPLSGITVCPGAKTEEALYAPLPVYVEGVVGSPVTEWPPAGTYDFCGYMDTILCQLNAVKSIVPEVVDYANLLRCLDADINGQVYDEPPAEIPVSISVNSSGECTVYWNGVLVHDNVAIPSWNPQAAWRMGFGARTGGDNDFHIVDDFDLTSTAMDYYESFSSGAGSGTLYGDAAIGSNQLVLTVDSDSLTGSWTFLPSGALSEFTVTYLQYIGDGSGADGMCFFYGAGADAAFGESGPGTPVPQEGLRVSFHTWDGSGIDNTIRLAYAGNVLADNASAGELRQTEEWLPVSGNGMMDGQYELALLQYVLNEESHPLHGDATTAYRNNFSYVKNLLQEALANEGYLLILPWTAPYLLGSLTSLVAGYATLGDPSTYEALDAVLDLLSDIGIEPPVGGIAAVTESVATVSSVDDFEGDGFSNMDEYLYVEENVGLTVNNYMGYVLNAPTAGVIGAKYYQVGTTITLSPKLTYGGVVEGVSWEKDSTPLGTDNPLVIANCLYTDAGEYTMTVTHRMGDAKGTGQVIGTGTVTVGDDPMPAAGLAGLAALSGAFALLAARRIRRRK